VTKIDTNIGEIEADFFIIAPGHSSFNTYKMLISKGVLFRNKPFAIGMRAEHPQEIINKSQWNSKSLPGVKAAEYKLTNCEENLLPVYSFCMCPGGKVVPATAQTGSSVVNGMSLYQRDGKFANAAIVAGIELEKLLKKKMSPLESLEWLENLEQSFYNIKKSYEIPAVRISDFLKDRVSSTMPESSFPFPIFSHNFKELFHPEIITSLKAGIKNFSNKIKGFEEGLLLGLESKTSSPIQGIRKENGLAEGFDNLYLCGEGSGYAGGIVSSAADGIKAAFSIISDL